MKVLVGGERNLNKHLNLPRSRPRPRGSGTWRRQRELRRSVGSSRARSVALGGGERNYINSRLTSQASGWHWISARLIKNINQLIPLSRRVWAVSCPSDAQTALLTPSSLSISFISLEAVMNLYELMNVLYSQISTTAQYSILVCDRIDSWADLKDAFIIEARIRI